MKYSFILLFLIAGAVQTNAQKLICKDGHIWFYSHTPVEDIEAHNRQGVAVLDPSEGSLLFTLLVKSFEFKRELMEEHFNENYMESDTYPKAGFKGTIDSPKKINFKNTGEYDITVSGELTVHGTTKNITTPGKIIVKENIIEATADFKVKPEDYDIVIPDLVKDKIAEEIEIHVNVVFNQK